MDFVSVWKAASIGFTGFFGMLALLTDYRDKDTNRITKWGSIAFTGIVLSTACGVTAQLKENADDAAKALKVAHQTNLEIADIQRALRPLGSPRFDLMLYRNCKGLKFAHGCAFSGPYLRVSGVPGIINTLEAIEFFAAKSTGLRDGQPDLIYVLDDHDVELSNQIDLVGYGPDPQLRFKVALFVHIFGPGNVSFNDGKIVSLLDLTGATVRLVPLNPLEVAGRYIDSMRVYALRVQFSNGQMVFVAGRDFHKSTDPVTGRIQFDHTFKSEMTPP